MPRDSAAADRPASYLVGTAAAFSLFFRDRAKPINQLPFSPSAKFPKSGSSCESMINLVLRSLHSVRQPLDDMVDVIGKDSAPVFDPRPSLSRVARPDCRRAIEVETAHIAPLDPAAL